MPAQGCAGLARAKADGAVLGRPKIDKQLETKIRNALKRRKDGIRKIAVAHGVGTGTVQRIRAEMA
jgi:DNA invertase Pin-like site-specific DNA recombinase